MAHEVIYVTIESPTVQSIPTTVGGSPTNVVDVDVDDTASNTAAISALTGRVTTAESDITTLETTTVAGVGPWIDLELISPFVASTGLQHPQWRSEGPAGRFRGHYQATSGTSTRRVAWLPPGFNSASTGHIFTGIGQTSGGTHTVARWDVNNGYGTLDVTNQFNVDHTFPMSMNARFLTEQASFSQSTFGTGTNISPWTFYGPPWSVPSDRLHDGRILVSGLAKNGPAGLSWMYRWDYDPHSDYRAAGGIWILPGHDGAGPTRFDAQNTVARLDVMDVSNAAYLAMDGLEWVSNNSARPWTAPTLLNSWGNYAGGYAPAGHTMFGDCVYIRGLVTGGTLGQPVFVLPEGRRPPAKMIFPVQNNGAVVKRLSVDVDGVVKQEPGGASGWVSLCVNFSVTP